MPLLSETGLRRLWHSVPAALRHRVDPLLQRAWAAKNRAAEQRRFAQWQHARVVGEGLGPAPQLTVEVFGDVATLEGAKIRLFAKPTAQDGNAAAPTVEVETFETLGRQELIRRATQALDDADIVLVDGPQRVVQGLDERFIPLPRTIGVVANLSESVAAIEARAQPLGTYLRKIESRGYTYDHHHRSSELERFHAQFYLPYRDSYGGALPPRPSSFYEAHPGSWEVFSVSEDGEWVGAGTGIRAHDRYRLIDLGFRDGQRSHMTRGAGHALYDCLIKRAVHLGYDRLDFGPHPPYLSDSVLHYKVQWGATIVADPWRTRTLALGVGQLSPQTRALLSAAPMAIQSDAGEFHALSVDEDVLETSQRYQRFGLRGACVLEAPGQLRWRSP